MLKIYLMKHKYELHGKNRIIKLSTSSNYVIRDEEKAVNGTMEFDAYTEEADDMYNYEVKLSQTKKGMRASYWTWDSIVYARQWIEPDAKLVIHIDYEETSCSMRKLMELPAIDVIAYLKQECIPLMINT